MRGVGELSTYLNDGERVWFSCRRPFGNRNQVSISGLYDLGIHSQKHKIRRLRDRQKAGLPSCEDSRQTYLANNEHSKLLTTPTWVVAHFQMWHRDCLPQGCFDGLGGRGHNFFPRFIYKLGNFLSSRSLHGSCLLISESLSLQE